MLCPPLPCTAIRTDPRRQEAGSLLFPDTALLPLLSLAARAIRRSSSRRRTSRLRAPSRAWTHLLPDVRCPNEKLPLPGALRTACPSFHFISAGIVGIDSRTVSLLRRAFAGSTLHTVRWEPWASPRRAQPQTGTGGRRQGPQPHDPRHEAPTREQHRGHPETASRKPTTTRQESGKGFPDSETAGTLRGHD